MYIYPIYLSTVIIEYNTIKRFGILFLLISSTLLSPVSAQVSSPELRNVQVDNLSDAQLRQIQTKLKASGIPEQQLLQYAVAQGMSASEAQKLINRINQLKPVSGGNATNAGNSLSQDTVGRRQENVPLSRTQLPTAAIPSNIFGADLFNNSAISFQPNLRIATPQNYVIGPDDQIQIDISGDNEANYKLTVSPEGTIRVEYAGVIPVSGLTVEQATARIKARLAGAYPSIRSGRTSVMVSLGNIRSIRVTLVGEVIKPGTYTLSALSPVFNALYESGGPARNGSFREIELIRGNRVIAKIDAYDFLLKGYITGNVRLQDQDVIRIPVYKVRAEMTGQVKTPKIFEVLPGETLADLLRFSGGFTERAYSAAIKADRLTERERQVSDVPSSGFQTFIPRNGDIFTVDSILNRYSNRVTLMGAVFRPGQFELQPGLTLRQLIVRADGIKEDAFLERATIVRLQPDNTPETISFNVSAVINGTGADIPLRREDLVTIRSIFELRDQHTVTINGEVRQPGKYGFSEGMNIKDLILTAGGLTDAASATAIEISRQLRGGPDAFVLQTAQIFNVAVDRNLNTQTPGFVLQPFDMVNVRHSAGYSEQRQITIQGEVLHPGNYTIADKNERISNMIKRAGGLLPEAYAAGASLKRQKNLRNSSNQTLIDYSIDDSLKKKNLERLKQSVSDTTSDSIDRAFQDQALAHNVIGIDLAHILKNPGGSEDLVLKEGDVVRVPEIQQTVKVSGEVLYPTAAVYKSNKDSRYYIGQAGGFTSKAKKGSIYVVYANGSVGSSKRFLLFRRYPQIRPGSEIFVPNKPEKAGLSTTEIVALSTILASLGGIIIGVLNLSR